MQKGHRFCIKVRNPLWINSKHIFCKGCDLIGRKKSNQKKYWFRFIRSWSEISLWYFGTPEPEEVKIPEPVKKVEESSGEDVDVEDKDSTEPILDKDTLAKAMNFMAGM